MLIERVLAADDSAVAAKPDVDTRFGRSVIASHDGARLPAIAVSSATDLIEAATGAALVAVDETQFLTLELVAALEQLSVRTPVVAAGLDFDFRGIPFEATALLEKGADPVQRLSATCGRCGGVATRTQRLFAGVPVDLSDPIVKVGGADLYEPRCVRCWSAERAAPSAVALSVAQADGSERVSLAVTARRGPRSPR